MMVEVEDVLVEKVEGEKVNEKSWLARAGLPSWEASDMVVGVT